RYTPSHHRVHHGRNEYCIDKNYGGALIIWDRLFGTFAPEGDKVVYGLVHKINTFEILHIQFHYYKYLWRRFNRYKKIFNKLGVLWKGPSHWRRAAIQSQLASGSASLCLHTWSNVVGSTASMLELLRCVLMVMLLRYGYMTAPAPLVVPIEAFVSISLLYWGLQTFSQLIAVKKKTT
ncbi:unnamed protein product, partial [Coregonus sp. 'balchen']